MRKHLMRPHEFQFPVSECPGTVYEMVNESRVYCVGCSEWYLSDEVDYKDLVGEVMIFRCEKCGKRGRSMIEVKSVMREVE